MVFRCAALSVQRREHASLFSPWPESLGDFMGRDPIQLASFAYACYKKDKELKTCNLPVRATRRTRRTGLYLVSACMLWCVLQWCVCVVNKSGGTIRYDCMVSLFAPGLSNASALRGI